METDFNPAEGTNAMAIRNVAVAFVVAIAMIGTTSAANRTWKSAVGSGSWSERGNWEEDAVPAAGDTVILQSDVAGAVITNDIGEMSIAGLQFLGSNAMTLSGPKLTLTGNLTTRNASVINCDLHVSQNVSFKCGDSNGYPQGTCEPTFNGNITIADGKYFYVTGFSGAQFNGTVTGTGAYLRNGTINWSTGSFHFNRPVSVKEIQHYEADQSKLYFNAAGNHYEKFTSSYTYYYFTVENAMAPEGVIAFNNSGALSAYRGYFLSADQTINRFDGSTNPGSTDGHWFAVSDESRHIEVTARGTADGSSYVRLVRNMGFTWAPTNSYVQEFVDRAHTAYGPLVVSNGTIKMSGTCSFKSVKQITVRKNATFHHASTEAAALRDVTLVTLEDGATFKVDEGASDPFTKSPMFIMGRNSKIDVAEGVTVSVGNVQTPSGKFPATGPYTSGNAADWVSGAGTVSVTANAVAWKDAIDGDFNVSANWVDGAFPSAGNPAYITANGANYTVSLSSAPAADAGGLRLANDGEHTNVLAVSAAVTFSGEKVEVSAGGRIEVNEGGTFVYSPPSAYGENTQSFLVRDGGRIEVNGGYLDNYNMHGKLAFSGSDDAEGVLAIHAGTCRVHNAWSGNGLWVYSGGRLEMDGGLLDLRLYTNNYRPLTLAGGTMDIGGDAVVRIGNGLGLYFGDGEANFSGNAKLSRDDATGRLAISPRTAGDVTRLAFTGNSALDMNGAIATYVGFNAPSGANAILRHASSATSYAGAICSVGELSGCGELDVESGRFHCGLYGLFVGANINGMVSAKDGVRAEGVVKVSDGVLSVDGQQSVHDGGHVVYGLVVGDGLVVSNDLASTSFYKGTLDMTGGVVSNIYGFTSVGLGKAKGTVRQTGGTFVTMEPGRSTIIGSFGGEGEWTMDGGTATLNDANLFVGGCILSDINRSSTFPLFGVTSGSQGRLSITNGSFSVGWNAHVGKNGDGLLELGTGGVFQVGGALNMHAGGVLKFVFGPEGTGIVRLGSLALDESARLVLDFSGHGEEAGRYSLVEADNNLGQFNEANVEIVGLPDTMRCSLARRGKTLCCSISKGFLLIFR